MSVITVAIGVPSGEMASELVASAGEHPLLDSCGIARSVPDLLRLLDRFRPDVLLISHSFLEELEPLNLAPGDVRNLSAPLSFIISPGGMSWGEEELSGLLRLPLRIAGLIGQGLPGNCDLFGEIRRKIELCGSQLLPATAPPAHDAGREENTGLFSCLGCKGGVGNTFFACALAAAAAASGRRVLLMEMDALHSQLLCLKPRDEGKTLLDLLPLAEEISWDLIKLSIHRHAAGFYLLPHGRSRGERPGEAALPETLLRNLLFLFDVVIQDFPASSRTALLPLLHHLPTVILVSLPDTITATCARNAASYLRGTGLDYERLRLVVNRCGTSHTLGPEELARAVGVELLAVLPDDPRSGLDFAELGQLPRADSPFARAATDAAVALGLVEAGRGGIGARPRFKLARRHAAART